MMEYTGADELEKYRKYIQKRRISAPRDIEAESAVKKPEGGSTAESGSKAEPDPYSLWNEKDNDPFSFGGTKRIEHKSFAETDPGEAGGHVSETSLSALRRHDNAIYKKLYSRNSRKQPAYSQSYKSFASSRAQIEDNRVSLIALKIIKQALACFAILGIIIFMQSREDMSGALELVKKHLIETNIEPRNLYEGIKDIVYQCSRLLGGTP